MKKYYLINVPGKYGYSFMVKTSETREDVILELATEKDLFDDADDAWSANVSEADDHDIKFFDEYTDLD